MDRGQGMEDRIQYNRILSRLTVDGRVAAGSTLLGYIGASNRDGCVSLYPNIRDLTVSYEIAIDDIAHVEEVPESVRPFGAVVVWLKHGAEKLGQRRVAESGRPPADPAMVETTSGRLRMERSSRAALMLHCTGSECSVCMSHCDCNPCQSVPSVMM